jgi:signal transduction histidine kinase
MDALRSSITLSLPHEFQTPLSGIIGLSELLMLQGTEIPPEEVYEYANGIHRSAKRLHRLIQNYLLYSKLLLLRSQGKAKFTSPYPTNSQMTIGNISDRKAREYDRFDDLDLDLVEVNLAVSSDDLVKITEELVDNAFKYSQNGSKVIVSSQINGDRWILTIQDCGRGMNDEQIANVGAFMQFERRFYEQQGTGLGLSLARTLVEFYGGDIEIQSKENLGTKILIALPL